MAIIPNAIEFIGESLFCFIKERLMTKARTGKSQTPRILGTF